MTAREEDPLREAFLQDHQHLTKGFNEILRALESDQYEEAIDAAKRLDRLAGPHIEFEETVLYPQVARGRGNGYDSHLYADHRVGQKVIRLLMGTNPEQLRDPSQKERLLRDIQTILDHAYSCGTLLSHLTASSDAEREEFLARLMDFRRQGHSWSELPSRPSRHP